MTTTAPAPAVVTITGVGEFGDAVQGDAALDASTSPSETSPTAGSPQTAALETSLTAGSPQTAAVETSAAPNSDELSAEIAASTVPPSTTASENAPHAGVRDVLDAATPLAGFREGVLGVSGPAGTQLWPVIVADTQQARQRGLMGITDFAALGGYAAMVFIFKGDTSGAFWMRDTPLPLRITFVTAGGSVVSVTDMVPCLAPTPSGDCEHYHPDGPYRFAIEHPLGPAFDIGLADAELVEVTVE